MDLDKIKRPNKPAENWIEACHLYMDTLKDVLTPIIYNTIYSIHEDAVRLTEKGALVERTFMDYLAEVKVWSITIINGESQEILQRCSWFSQLLRGVFVSNVMVLSSAQLNRPNAPASKLRLNIPPVPVFVQALYTQVAQRFFNQPHLFKTQGVPSDQMIENKNQAQREIHQAIEATVRGLLPLPQIIESAMNFRGNNPIISAKQAPSRRRDTSSVAFPNLKTPVEKKSLPSEETRELPARRSKSPVETILPKKSVVPTVKAAVAQENEFRQSQISFSAPRKTKIRPSEFRQRVKSEALDEVLDRLRFDSVESRESPSLDSSDSDSSL